MPLDDGAVRTGCRGAKVATARHLCRAEIERFRSVAGVDALAQRRAEQARRQLSAEIEEELKAQLAGAGFAERVASLEGDVAAGRMSPRSAAKAILAGLVQPPKP